MDELLMPGHGTSARLKDILTGLRAHGAPAVSFTFTSCPKMRSVVLFHNKC